MDDKEGVEIKQEIADTDVEIKDPFIEKVASSIAHIGETPLQAYERSLENHTNLDTRVEILNKTTKKVVKGGEEEPQDNSANKARGIS